MNRHHPSKFFQIATIIVISGLCLLFDLLTQTHYNKVVLPRNRPEYRAIGVDARIYNHAGKLLYKTLSEQVYQFPHDVRIFLDHAKLYVYDKKIDMVEYLLTADDGWVDQDHQLASLGKNVVAVVYNSDPSKVITVKTSNAMLDLHKNIVSGKEIIKASQGKNSITALGFSFDNDRQFLVLESKVHVVYYQVKK